jgi:hypothetical protein
LFSVALLVIVAAMMAFASTALAKDLTNLSGTVYTVDHSAVIGSVHDVTRNVPGSNPCSNCHIPHTSSASAKYLFSRTPDTSGGGSVTAANEDTGVTSDIQPLCYSCHDGTVATAGLTTTFSATHTNHRTHAATQLQSSGSPYGTGRDCDLCHDPHDDGNTKFLKYERYSTHNVPAGWSIITAGGNVCASCHAGNVSPGSGGASTNNMNHPTNIVPSAASTPIDAIWGMTSSGPDYSGTRLFDPTSHLVSTIATAQVACETCHSPHGAEPTATYVSGSSTVHSLNTMATGQAQLCLNCHGAGVPATTSTTAGATTTTAAGGTTTTTAAATTTTTAAATTTTTGH